MANQNWNGQQTYPYGQQQVHNHQHSNTYTGGYNNSNTTSQQQASQHQGFPNYGGFNPQMMMNSGSMFFNQQQMGGGSGFNLPQQMNNHSPQPNRNTNYPSYNQQPPQQRQQFPPPPPNPNQNGGMQYGMNPNMSALQQMAMQGSFRNPFQQQPQPPRGPFPPPPPNKPIPPNNQSPQKKKKKKHKKKKHKHDKHEKGKHPGNGDNDSYTLSAPKPRGSRTKKIGRIRNSFLMTSHKSQGGSGPNNLISSAPSMSSLHETSENENGGGHHSSNQSHGHRRGLSVSGHGQQPYSERRKKKVSYSRKETGKMKLKLLSSDTNMKKLRDVEDQRHRNKLIMKKIHLCKYVCDFRLASAGDKDEKHRVDNKLALLQELSTHFETSSRWTEGMGSDLPKLLESLCKMTSHNLFRVLPDALITEVVDMDNSGKDAKISISKQLPSWVHLELIYTIFQCVIRQMKERDNWRQIMIKCLSQFNVVSNTLYLLNSEDLREEEAVANILSLLYTEYPPVRLFVLGQLSNMVYSYLYNDDRRMKALGADILEKNRDHKELRKQMAVGINTVLRIFRDCLEASDADDLDGWVELLCMVIIPLFKAPVEEFTLFDDALSKLCITFCEKYFLSFIYIFQGLLRYWPVTSSKKERLFLQHIGRIIDEADEDVWEFRDKMQCEFHAVFTEVARKMVDAVVNVEHVHYATAEKIFEMLEDDTLQRFVDIYGGKECYIKLYTAMHEISTTFFWKETIDKSRELMELCKDEDDIPMQYVDDYELIEKGEHPHNKEAIEEERRVQQKRVEREQYWKELDRKYQHKSVAQYQKHVYKNEQPMLQFQKVQTQTQSTGLPPPQIWDEDDF